MTGTQILSENVTPAVDIGLRSTPHVRGVGVFTDESEGALRESIAAHVELMRGSP